MSQGAQKLFDLKEAAKKLYISEEQARGLVQDGELQFINVGRGKKRPRMRFTEADLDDLIERRRRKSEPCLFTNRKSHRFTSTTSKPAVIGFTARRNAQLGKTPKNSRP
jgi:excisionase family DNA binding protein